MRSFATAPEAFAELDRIGARLDHFGIVDEAIELVVVDEERRPVKRIGATSFGCSLARVLSRLRGCSALTSERSVSPCVGERVPAFLGAAERDYSGRSHV